MSFGDHVETRSELEAAELDRENRVADRLAERRKDAVLVRIRMGEVAAENLAAWARAVARSGLRGSGPRPQNSETIIPYQQVKTERDTALDALAHEETESRRLAGMVMSLDLLVMSANEIICNSPGNIQPWLDACAVLGRNLTPSG